MRGGGLKKKMGKNLGAGVLPSEDIVDLLPKQVGQSGVDGREKGMIKGRKGYQENLVERGFLERRSREG